MVELQLVTAPDPVFRKKAEPVEVVNDDIRAIVDGMLSVMYAEGAMGLGSGR